MVPPRLPDEAVNFSSFASDLRNPLSLKVDALRKNYVLQETMPGREITFFKLDKSELAPVAVIHLEATLSPDKTERHEVTVITDGGPGNILLREDILTTGQGLALSAPADKLLFNSATKDYELDPSDTQKIVTLSSDGHELVKLVSTRTDPQVGIATSEIWIGQTLQLTIKTVPRIDRVILTYQYSGQRYEVRTRHNEWSASGMASLMRIEVLKPNGYEIGSPRFFYNATEFFVLNDFLEFFNASIYAPVSTRGLAQIINGLLTNDFPVTVTRDSLEVNSRFRTELQTLALQIDQARTNPSLLAQILIKVNSFIAAIRAGTLVITDRRPQQ